MKKVDKIGSGEYGLLVTYVGGKNEERWFKTSEARRQGKIKLYRNLDVLIASLIGKLD